MPGLGLGLGPGLVLGLGLGLERGRLLPTHCLLATYILARALALVTEGGLGLRAFEIRLALTPPQYLHPGTSSCPCYVALIVTLAIV